VRATWHVFVVIAKKSMDMIRNTPDRQLVMVLLTAGTIVTNRVSVLLLKTTVRNLPDGR